jgi:hypothetical protein
VGRLLSHVSAAALWGIVPDRRPDAPVDVTIAGTQTPRHPGIHAHRTSTLDAREDVRILDALLNERRHGSGFSRSAAEIKLRHLIRDAQLPAPGSTQSSTAMNPTCFIARRA